MQELSGYDTWVEQALTEHEDALKEVVPSKWEYGTYKWEYGKRFWWSCGPYKYKLYYDTTARCVQAQIVHNHDYCIGYNDFYSVRCWYGHMPAYPRRRNTHKFVLFWDDDDNLNISGHGWLLFCCNSHFAWQGKLLR